MKKNKVLNIIITVLILIILIGTSYAFFAYSRVSDEISKFVTGDIYMHYIENNELELLNAFPQTKEEGLLNKYFEFSVSGKNTTKNKDIYYAINLVYGDDEVGLTRYHDEDIVFYLTEVVDGEEVVLIDSVQYKSINDAKIYVETIPKETNNEIEHTYRLRMWIDEDVLISDTNPNANYTTGEYKNSYTSVKVNVEGNLTENDINLVLDANDDNYVNGKRAIYVDTYGYTDDDLVLEVTSDNENIEFLYVDEYENSIEEAVSKLELSYQTNKKDVITTRVIPVSKNDANTKTKLTFKLTRNGEVVEQQVKSLTVYGNNFCLNNGFNKLYDCILASEAMSSNVESAKTFIANKGEPNLNDTAPSYTYVEDITYDVENVYITNPMNYAFADSYQLNQTTGYLELINTDGSDEVLDSLSDKYINYYTCGENSRNITHCDVVYLVKGVAVTESTYTISLGDKITPKISSSIKSEVGLYKVEDDYGDSYVFRGDVSNNNVYFGGYYWKILRTNGDNSIRLIYNGESENATGINTSINNTNYPYSSRSNDPTYLGYMYGNNFAVQTSDETWFDSFNAQAQYYWADSYEFDSETEMFNLKSENLDIVSGTFAEMQDMYEEYPYTCTSNGVTQSCEIITKVKNYNGSSGWPTVQYVSYSSTSKDATRTNEKSSDAKIELEKWYETNLVGKKDDKDKLITDYFVDGTFCNDRQTAFSTYNSGYKLGEATYYSPLARLGETLSGEQQNKTATLKCSNDIRDKFSSTTSKGNGLLDYPVALITADEVALAGGKYQVTNEKYYLRNNHNYFTMSPGLLAQQNASALIWFVEPSGSMTIWNSVRANMGLRPVINLSNDVLIASGDGSIESPYELKLS